MTEDQSAAYVVSQSTCATIEAMGMQAENLQRAHRGESIAYVTSDFLSLIGKYGIGHNAVITTLKGKL